MLKHRDSMHSEWQSVVPDEVQIMSAGTGLQHSEINGSTDEYLSLFQIWIIPNKKSAESRYGQKTFDAKDRKNKLQTLVTSIDENHEGSLKIHQDAVISRIDLDKGMTFEYKLKSKNHGVYIMVIDGTVNILNIDLEFRDAIGICETKNVLITANGDSNLLLIEVPMEV